MRGRRGRRGRGSERNPEQGLPHRAGHIEPRAARAGQQPPKASLPPAPPAPSAPGAPSGPGAPAPAAASATASAAPPGAAVLVDGDNVPPEVLATVLALAERGGPVTERRVYRNWRSTKHATQWDALTKRHAFERMDRYATAKGKNSSDVALVVGAVDLYHAGVRRFLIVSGDTDFAPLVDRLRRGGAHVTLVGHNVEGGLLAEIADVYLDWRRLGKGGAEGPRGRAAPAPSKAAGAGTPAKGRPRQNVQPRAPAPAAKPARPAKPGQSGAGGPRGAPAVPSAGAAPAATPTRRPAGPESRRLLEQVLLDAYEVARTDGEVDAQGFVPVARLGQIARTVDPRFGPALYGLATRTPMYKLFQSFPDRFEVATTGEGRRQQYQVRLLRR